MGGGPELLNGASAGALFGAAAMMAFVIAGPIRAVGWWRRGELRAAQPHIVNWKQSRLLINDISHVAVPHDETKITLNPQCTGYHPR